MVAMVDLGYTKGLGETVPTDVFYITRSLSGRGRGSKGAVGGHEFFKGKRGKKGGGG